MCSAVCLGSVRLLLRPKAVENTGTLKLRHGCIVDCVLALEVWILLLVLADFELGPMLVESHGVAEVMDGIGWRLAEGQFPWDEANTGDAIEKTKKVDIHIGAKRLLEVTAHPKSLIGIVFVEVVGEIDLGAVAGGQQADFVQHSSQTADRIGASREAKQADFISFVVILHQESVRVLDVNTLDSCQCQDNTGLLLDLPSPLPTAMSMAAPMPFFKPPLP